MLLITAAWFACRLLVTRMGCWHIFISRLGARVCVDREVVCRLVREGVLWIAIANCFKIVFRFGANAVFSVPGSGNTRELRSGKMRP